MDSILLTDDSRSIRQIVASALRTAGYDVAEAQNGQEGVQLARSRSFDLMLTDLNMPGVDGLEFTRQVRQLAEHRNTPILVVTTESGAAQQQQAKAAGANGWIVKPIQPKRLVEVVTQVIGRNRGTQR